MPVADVKAVLAAPDSATRNTLIARHLDRLESELAQTRAAVDSLRNLLERPHAPITVEHRSVPAVHAVAIRQDVDRQDILAWWQGAFGELRATVRAQRLRPSGPGGGLYASEIFQHDRGQATVFIPVEGSARPIGRVVPLEVPAAELAIMTHHGSLDNADLTYSALGSYATAHEISIDGPLREYYLRNPATTPNPVEWETEIGWPIFRADAST